MPTEIFENPTAPAQLNPFEQVFGKLTKEASGESCEVQPAQPVAANSRSELVPSPNAHKIERFHGRRTLALWKVAAISLGYPPFKGVHHRLWTTRGQLQALYQQRVGLLLSRLSKVPRTGYVTIVADHPAADLTDALREQMIDAVSAFLVLREEGVDMPTQAHEFEQSVLRVPKPVAGEPERGCPVSEQLTHPRSSSRSSKELKYLRVINVLLKKINPEFGPDTAGRTVDELTVMASQYPIHGLGDGGIKSAIDEVLKIVEEDDKKFRGPRP